MSFKMLSSKRKDLGAAIAANIIQQRKRRPNRKHSIWVHNWLLRREEQELRLEDPSRVLNFLRMSTTDYMQSALLRHPFPKLMPTFSMHELFSFDPCTAETAHPIDIFLFRIRWSAKTFLPDSILHVRPITRLAKHFPRASYSRRANFRENTLTWRGAFRPMQKLLHGTILFYIPYLHCTHWNSVS
jgi:hypothetical protein